MTSDAAVRARVRRRKARRGVRLTTRGRIVVVLLLAMLAALVALGIDAATSEAASERSGSVHRTVIVQQGETLWSIALQARPSDDPRDTVQRILDMNSLTSPVIVPGQQLAVPLG